MKRALITGVTGQDGSYLADLLLDKGYEVHGVLRRSSSPSTARIEHINGGASGARLLLHYADLSYTEGLVALLRKIEPHEIYHLAAQSHVGFSFDMPELTGDVTGLSTTRVLEAVRASGIATRVYQTSSSEMYGDAPAPQTLATPFRPQSPYAVAKLYAYWMAAAYREAYGLFVCSGVLFNHESPRRGESFVTRKVTLGIAAILAGRQRTLRLGNLAPKRDWGYAPEYCEAMWLMLQQDQPADYTIGTGEAHSVEEFVERAFARAGLDWRDHVEVDPLQFRPTDIACLRADPADARERLGWEANVRFAELAAIMVDADLEAAGLRPAAGSGAAAGGRRVN